MKTTNVFKGISVFFVFMFTISIVVGYAPLSANIEPENAASSDFGVQIGDWAVYRTYINNSKNNLEYDEYLNITVYSMVDVGSNTTINWTIFKAVYPNFVFMPNGTGGSEYDITDNATWWGNNYIIPKNVDLSAYSAYLDTQWLVWFSGVSGLSTTYTASTINVTGTKNSKPFMFFYETIPSLGLVKRMIFLDEENLKVTTLAKSNKVASPNDYGLVPGDILKYYTPVMSINSKFMDYIIDFVYEEGTDVVLVATQKFILTSGGEMLLKYREAGRIRGANISVGYDFQRKDLDMSGREAEMIAGLTTMGLTSINIISLQAKYLQFSAMSGSNQIKMEYRLPNDNSIGGTNFFAEYENGNMKSVRILIDGKGTNQNPANYPYISLPEGAFWERISNNVRDSREPKPGGGEIYFREGQMVYLKFQITHIFEWNGSGAVYGDIWESSTRTFTTKREVFYPLLIHDGGANINFIDATEKLKVIYNVTYNRGYGPILFPSNINFDTVKTQLEMMLKQMWGISSFSFYETGPKYALGSIYNNDTYFYAKVNSYGLLEEHKQRMQFRNSTHEKREMDISFLLSMSVGCGSPVEQTFGVTTGDSLVWERSSSEDPARKEWDKKQIISTLDTCSGSKIILSSQFYKKNKTDDWSPSNYCINKTWGVSGPECLESTNLYLTNLINKNDRLTWMECDILPKEMITAGFVAKKADIMWVINAFMGQVTDANINVWDRGFVAWQVDSEGWNHSMHVQFNAEGIIQDMMWMDQKSGSPTRWKRQVLVTGPGAKYEYFPDPSGYIPAERDETEEPSGINGYPILIFSLFSVAAIAYMMKKKYTLVR